MINKKWSLYNGKNIYLEKNFIGIYELANKNKTILYIGKGLIHTRLYTHKLKNNSHYINDVKYYRSQYVNSWVRAGQMERVALKQFIKNYGKYPKFNDRYDKN